MKREDLTFQSGVSRVSVGNDRSQGAVMALPQRRLRGRA